MPDFLMICSFSEETVYGAFCPKSSLTAARQNAKSASIEVIPKAASTILLRISIDKLILHCLSTTPSVFSISNLSGNGMFNTVTYFSNSTGSL